MAFAISEALPSGAEALTRDCDFPALQGNPLHESMFHQKTPDNSEEIIQWMVDGLHESFRDPRMKFFKACTSDGTIVGFAGWTALGWAKDSEKSGRNEQTRKNSMNVPKSVDTESWIMASRQLAEGKRRVLKDQDAIYRLNLISVNLPYQGKRFGSSLMEWGCRQADDSGAEAFAMASPGALGLYRKFEFEEVGHVQIGSAKFSSMTRKPRQSS